MLAGFVSYLLRTNVSVVGEAMITDLGLSEIQFGAILSAFAVGYAIFQFPGGIFGDKVGSRIAMTAAAIGWGVLTIAIAMVPGRPLGPAERPVQYRSDARRCGIGTVARMANGAIRLARLTSGYSSERIRIRPGLVVFGTGHAERTSPRRR